MTKKYLAISTFLFLLLGLGYGISRRAKPASPPQTKPQNGSSVNKDQLPASTLSLTKEEIRQKFLGYKNVCPFKIVYPQYLPRGYTEITNSFRREREDYVGVLFTRITSQDGSDKYIDIVQGKEYNGSWISGATQTTVKKLQTAVGIVDYYFAGWGAMAVLDPESNASKNYSFEITLREDSGVSEGEFVKFLESLSFLQ